MHIIEVARHIIFLASKDKVYSLTPLKLQKLLYYTQGFSYLWDKEELFTNGFEAWDYGPVNREIYYRFNKYGQNEIPFCEGDETVECPYKVETIEVVWDKLKEYSAFELVEMTHKESPWIKAYHGNKMIKNEDIRDYFIIAYQ